MKYSIILADPPWQYEVWRDAGKGRTAASHYGLVLGFALHVVVIEVLAGVLATIGVFVFVWWGLYVSFEQ